MISTYFTFLDHNYSILTFRSSSRTPSSLCSILLSPHFYLSAHCRLIFTRRSSNAKILALTLSLGLTIFEAKQWGVCCVYPKFGEPQVLLLVLIYYNGLRLNQVVPQHYLGNLVRVLTFCVYCVCSPLKKEDQ